MNSIQILGVMTGTSSDALDACCLEFQAQSWRPLWSESRPYPDSLRKRVLEIQKPKQKITTQALLELHRDLGLWYGETLQKILSHRQKPDVIANHGQTIAHFPLKKGTVTLQLGEPSWISQKTGLTVVGHFREGDTTAGGDGAPLAPLFHREIAHRFVLAHGVAIHNLGGISNLTYIPPNGEILAFDTGPANIWIDECVRKITRGKKQFDLNGALARKGKADTGAIKKLMKFSFFKKAPPKTTGRDDFPFSLLTRATKKKGNDLVATATEFTVESITHAYETFILKKGLPLSTVLFSGGGALNPYLLNRLSERLGALQIKVGSVAEIGLNPTLIEPQAFAYLAYRSLLGQSIGGTWTGSKGFAPPAQIVPGQNWKDVVQKIQSHLESDHVSI